MGLRLLLGAIVMVGVAFAGQADAQSTPITIKGAGAAPCTEALRVYGPTGNQADRGLYLQWALGLSVGAALANQVVDVSPTGEVMDLVQIAVLICQEQQSADANWYSAVSTAIARMRPYWARNPDRVSVQYQGQEHWFYTDMVRQLQADLITLGYAISADGSFGPATGAAVSAAQARINIQNNPVPTAMLFYALTRPSGV